MTKYRLAPLGRLTKINFDALDIDANCVVTDIIANIDSFTSKFNDEEEIKKHLEKYFKLSNDLFIYYEKDGIKYATRVITKEDENFIPYIDSALDEGNPRYVSVKTEQFRNDLVKLLQSTKNDNYIRYLFANGFISEYLNKKLLQYRDARGEEEKQIIDKIIDTISNYKTLRNLYIGTRSYERENGLNKDRKGNKEVEVEDKELYEVFQPLENEELFYKTNITTGPKYFNEAQRNIADAYLEGGMDEVYENIDDLHDVGLTENDLKRIERADRKRR